MAPKLCKEQQIWFGNNVKYSDFIAGDIFFAKWALKMTLLLKKIKSSEKFCGYFLLLCLVLAFVDIINIYQRNFRQIIGTEVRNKKSLKI